jgi:hypothetical protein
MLAGGAMSDEGNPIDVNARAAVGSKGLTTLLAEATMTNPCMRRRLQFELDVGRVFHQACADLVKVIVDAEAEPKLFAEKAVSAISSNQ